MQSCPKVRFPDGFSLSANVKHHSNTGEVLKHLEEIVIPYANVKHHSNTGEVLRHLEEIVIPYVNVKHHSNTGEVLRHLEEIVIPYVNAERAKLANPDQFSLLIWDVFRGQKTDEVTSLLTENKILYEYVPNNMTADFQVLDLTVNKWVKNITMNKFNAWFADILRRELDSGKTFDGINIKFKLTTMKPLHAGWLIDVYNQLSSSDGKQIILSGCEKLPEFPLR